MCCALDFSPNPKSAIENLKPVVSHVEPSSDQPTRPGKHLGRNGQANLLGSCQVDHELKLGRLLHGQIGRLGALKNPVHVICDAPVALRFVRPVGHEPTGIYEFSPVVHRR